MAVVLGPQLSHAATVSATDKSDNVTLVDSFRYRSDDRSFIDKGGTDMAFQGRYLYAAEQGRDGLGGGAHIFDVARGVPRKVSFFPCSGWQNDVAVVRPGLIALAYHDGKLNCGNPSGGITLIDVSKPIRLTLDIPWSPDVDRDSADVGQVFRLIFELHSGDV